MALKWMKIRQMNCVSHRDKGQGREGKGKERKGREGKGREGKGREGKGREGKGREGRILYPVIIQYSFHNLPFKTIFLFYTLVSSTSLISSPLDNSMLDNHSRNLTFQLVESYSTLENIIEGNCNNCILI